MLALTRILRMAITATAVPLMLTLGLVPAAHAQKSFATPEAAMNAFGDAVTTSNDTAIDAIFGNQARRLIPPLGAEIRYKFLSAWSQSHSIQKQDDNTARIAVGNDGWTMPIPLVRRNGQWQFDTQAGLTEIRLRRIGRNELSTIQTMLAVYDAQREYASTDHSGDGMLVYAAHLVSSPGKRDGLYWPTSAGEPESPLGSAFLRAVGRNASAEGYNGYRFKLLTSQGPAAPGGQYNYLVNGRLFGGFAVLAWPVKYGETGIKSFIVNHEGQVYERDLGKNTSARADGIQSFDPVPGWSKVSATAP
ncbi:MULTISPECIES: DUF2950 domain-containing protein [Cupriavidus]|uniref:DUF2950 domain-containing protein n=1 Tax=Cupriavidus metallidurans TaxID=119219 RepID=A0A482INZ8_9BURK|nr:MULTISPECIES: DUF2950 domain-containing protein [Cupriavidus]KWR70945.1 hypothetical protein RN01_32215 [Cupriavidus sp. SHE]QBP09666.1 DUF2950 domain-containing protein [Cupriavidus metallidurans]QWC90017.1 DUF2950 domain-containing protein [Cupriavidus metallidurans]